MRKVRVIASYARIWHAHCSKLLQLWYFQKDRQHYTASNRTISRAYVSQTECNLAAENSSYAMFAYRSQPYIDSSWKCAESTAAKCTASLESTSTFIRHTMQIRPYFADNSRSAKLMLQRSMDVNDHTTYSLNECLSKRVSNCIVPEIRPIFGFCEGVT